MNDSEELRSEHFDVLKELGNIGSGHAVTALAKMLDRKIDMKVPSVRFSDFCDLADVFGGPENYVAGVLVTLSGDLSGMMMFLLEKSDAESLLYELFFKEMLGDQPFTFGEMELSALKELGNILSNSYLSSLSDMLNLKIWTSPPYLAIDMAGALLSVPAIEFSKVSDKVLFIDTLFAADALSVNGYFILVPEFESFKVIMSNLGVI